MRNVIIKISCIVMLIGFYILLGTAGSSDLDLISMKDILSRAGIGLGMILIGYGGLKLGGGRYVN